jgi:hypothetical protein
MEGQARCADANKQDCLTPIATDDDYPTPRFNSSAACESPGPSFGTIPITVGKGIDEISHHETCQYVLQSCFIYLRIAPRRRDPEKKLFIPHHPEKDWMMAVRSE